MQNKQINKNLSKNSAKGFFLHASSVLISKGALLFLGHSGAGKSTISRILSERYPLIADDKVFVYRKNNDNWWIRGVADRFFSWKGGKCALSSTEYPLHAIIRIFKGSTTKLTPLSKKDTCRHLTDAIFENDFQKRNKNINLLKSWFGITKEISEDIYGWSLTFPKNKIIIKNISISFEENWSMKTSL